MYNKDLSEADICAKYITPAVVHAGWDEATQIRREVGFTKGRIIVRGKLVTRGKARRADYVLYYQHIPIALIEAKCLISEITPWFTCGFFQLGETVGGTRPGHDVPPVVGGTLSASLA
jgi:hypothetical protein